MVSLEHTRPEKGDAGEGRELLGWEVWLVGKESAYSYLLSISQALLSGRFLRRNLRKAEML
jgi:hypothetical protein